MRVSKAHFSLGGLGVDASNRVNTGASGSPVNDDYSDVFASFVVEMVAGRTASGSIRTCFVSTFSVTFGATNCGLK